MFFLVVLFSLLTLPIVSVSQEYTVKRFGYKFHVFIRFLICSLMIYIIFTIIAISNYGASDIAKVLFNFNFEISLASFIWLFLFLINYVACVVLFNRELNNASIYLLELLMKISIIFISVIEIVRGEIALSFTIIIGTTLFILGIIIIFDLRKIKDVSKNKMAKASIITISLLVLLNIAYPYQLQFVLRSGYTDRAGLFLISSIATSIYGLLFLKPNLSHLKNSLIPYAIQSALFFAAFFLTTYLVEISILAYIYVIGLAGLLLTFASSIFLKSEISPKNYVGVAISLVGFVLMQIVIN